MVRVSVLAWICSGALGLGILVLAAARRNKQVGGHWYVLAPLLGPIFLCFILPIWAGRWGENESID